MNEQKVLKIIAIKTKEGYFIKQVCTRNSYSQIEHLYFDRKKANATFNKKWFSIPQKPTKIERLESQPNINYRYELIDETLLNPDRGIKKVYKRDEVAYKCEYEDGWIWNDDVEHLSSLYKLVSDKQPDIFVDFPFEFDVILELDVIREHDDFSYSVGKERNRYASEHQEKFVTNKSTIHQVIDTILFPSIVLPDRPCKLSSEDTYKIVREHIKTNINPKYAEITSDYDFCFTVKKKIDFKEPEKYTVDVNKFHKRRKPKYEDRWRKSRYVECFEMTWEPKAYGGYTPIEGFIGENQTDLKNKVDKYLEELIEYINQPLKDCPSCEGRGVMNIEKR